MSENPNSVNDRLQQANQSGGGTPQINPDEQRKYLGTFRERVSLAIKNKDLASSYAQKAVDTELKKNPHYNLVINANNSMNLTVPYMKIAEKYNVNYDMVSDNKYSTKPDAYGLIYATKKTAINQRPIDLYEKYPQNNGQSKSKKSNQNNQSKQSFWSKIKSWF